MFIIRTTLNTSLNYTLNQSLFKLTPNLVKSLWTSTKSKEEGDKHDKEDYKPKDEPKDEPKAKNDSNDDQRAKDTALKEQEQLFKQFSTDSGLTLADKQTKFLDMLFRFKDQNIHYQRLGDCEFVLGALKILKPLNLHRELEVYKQLMSVFPKEKMKTESYYQQVFTHYPKHQETAVCLLEEMGNHNVFPDKEMRIIVRDIFGGLSDVHRKVMSINYWNTKLARKSPFPTPDRHLEDKFEIAKLALKKMCCTVDAETKIQKYNSSIATMDVENNEWILYAQSINQKKLINRLDEILYVEGPFTCFVQHEESVKYFVLKTNTPNPYEFVFKTGELDVSRMKISTFGRKEVVEKMDEKLRLHHQEDGAILATCITEKASQQSLLAWIRILCKFNPKLESLQIVFKLSSDDKK